MGRIRYVFSDFLIMVIIASVIASSGWLLFNIIFSDECCECRLKIVTEPIPKEYSEHITVGGTLYDNISKRAIGTVENLTTLPTEEEKTRFELLVSARRLPRGGGLICGELFFFTEECIPLTEL